MTETTKQTGKTVDAILDCLVSFKFWLEVAAYMLGAVLLLIGGLTLLANREDGRRQEHTILRLENEVVESKRALASEQLAGRRLLLSLAPRRLGSVNSDSQVKRLKQFSGMPVRIEFLPQLEPRRAADALAESFRSADWQVIGPIANENLWDATFDGVLIWYASGPNSVENLPEQEQDRVLKAFFSRVSAAKSVEEYLSARKWQGVRVSTAAHSDTIPADGIIVRVGFKPEPQLQADVSEDGPLGWILRHESNRPLPLERSAPRTLSQDQRESITRTLAELDARNEPRTPVEIRCPKGNDEALSFANELAEVFRDSDREIVGGGVIVDEDFPRVLTGITVHPETFSGWTPILQSLSEAGLEFKVAGPAVILDEGSIRILVGW